MVQSFPLLYTRVNIILTLIGYAHSFSTFQWPNPQLRYADNQLYEGSMGILVQDCPSRENTTIPAQWLRIVSDCQTYTLEVTLKSHNLGVP